MGTFFIGDDGLKYCTICEGALQTRLEVPLVGVRIVNCICECLLRDNRDWKERLRGKEIEINKSKCFLKQRRMLDWNFSNDDNNKPELTKVMKEYVNSFDDFKREGRGLILYGGTGTGKSFYAGCIANSLLDEGKKVLMATMSALIDEIHAEGFGGKNKFLQRLDTFSLLIVDDLGAEGTTDYIQSMVFDVIDSRYRSGLPMVITTNLTATELKKVDDKQKKRIYDRILERCHPIEVGGSSRRREKLKADFLKVRERLGM